MFRDDDETLIKFEKIIMKEQYSEINNRAVDGRLRLCASKYSDVTKSARYLWF